MNGPFSEDSAEVRAYLAAIVNSSDDVIISKNLDGVITSWNRAAAKLFGYSPDEAIGKHIGLIVPPEKMEEEYELLNTILHGEMFFSKPEAYKFVPFGQGRRRCVG